MRTTFVMDPPPIVEDWLAERRALGQDLYDEVWEGEYRVAPAGSRRHSKVQGWLIRVLGPRADRAGLEGGGPCNIGRPGDFRVPDLAYFRDAADLTWNPTAAIVAEVVSPGDDSRHKFDFYHRHGVEEVLIVDPATRTVEWFERGPDGFQAADASAILGISSAELAELIDWPA